MDKARIQHPMAAARRRDTGDPQTPEIPLAVAAVAIRVQLRLVHRFRGGTKELALRAVIALRKFKPFLMTRARLGSAFGPWHVSVSSRLLVPTLVRAMRCC